MYKPADAKGRAENVPVPVLPEEAKMETKEGATAFARYWFSVLSYAYETGNLEEFDRITPATCDACASARKVIESWHSDGRWLVGGKILTPAVETTFQRAADKNYQVVVQARQAPLTYMRKDGSVARQDPQTDDTANLVMIDFVAGAWSLKSVGQVVG